jgi:hypothetical protein
VKIVSKRKALKNSGIGLAIGLAILPLFFAIFMLYLPALGYDPVYGDINIESIIYDGYKITADDIASFKTLKEMLSDIALCGFIFGLVGALIGFIMSRETTVAHSDHSA